MDSKGISEEYAPPPGPPPSHASSSYQPPDGPPPSYQNATSGSYETTVAEPPAYPPPPGLVHDSSTGSNATKDEAEQAKMWCGFYPLTPPFLLPPLQLRAIHAHDHRIITPPNFRGTSTLVNQTYHTWRVTSPSRCKDTLIQTALPCFSHFADSPMLTERSKTIYFEIQIRSLGTPPERSRFSSLIHRRAANENEEAGVAIGFFAPPYPGFRLPGWQRGSLGVHSDDGRRYVGNTVGGVDFTTPFQVGETIGLGMTFDVSHSDQGPIMNSQVFFTRDGKEVGGWDLLNDTDKELESVVGLQGDNDIFPAIGIYGPVDVDLHFGEESWLYRGWNQST